MKKTILFIIAISCHVLLCCQENKETNDHTSSGRDTTEVTGREQVDTILNAPDTMRPLQFPI